MVPENWTEGSLRIFGVVNRSPHRKNEKSNHTPEQVVYALKQLEFGEIVLSTHLLLTCWMHTGNSIAGSRILI
ncbi:MAG: hypothetical protein EAZ65_02670 [Verrucomicrobia bacterium]|nr:MAG: hypothetical protein EAZ84_10120 [Verrucomicrobiota bacterium]TAE88844.1 MAG: hypothetical protein EAZ82_02055 [Verrucomicrobiota bacterium]TAF27261.1 MAG: hypothetical protein EAZ71_02020 [Verrucomicrobiota bacterium]TAF42448.1 MAG: hypothetical protein EAZ65_02670 [Verrucomicrobiota bacterium]